MDYESMTKEELLEELRVLNRKLCGACGSRRTQSNYDCCGKDEATSRDMTEREKELLRSRDDLERGMQERARELEEWNKRLSNEVAQRTLARELLERSEARYRDLFENAGDAIYTHDLEGNFTSANRAAEILMGAERGHLLGLNVKDVILPGYELLTTSNLQRKLTGDVEITGPYEVAIRRLDGEHRWVEVTSRLLTEEGVVIGVQGSARDITDRKRTEEALRRSEHLHRSVLENIQDVFYRADFEGKLLMTGPSGARLFGYSGPEEMIGLPVESFWVEPKEREKLLEMVRRDGRVRDFETVLKKKDGSTFIASMSTHLYKDETGRSRGTEGIIRDVTARRKAEEELRFSREMFYTFTDQMPANVFIKDRHSRFQYANTLMRSTFECDDWIDRTADEYLPLDKAQAVLADDRRALSKGPIVKEEWMTDRHGNDRLFETRKFPIHTSEGSALLGGVSIDITERRATEESLKENERFLSDIFESIKDGISILDTDLTVIRVNSTMEQWYAHHMPLVGKKCYEVYHKRDTPCTVCPSRRAIEYAKPDNDIVPIVGPAGEIAGWVDLHAFPLTDRETGKVKGVIEYVRDITDTKLAEDEITHLFTAVEQAGEIIVITDRWGTITYVNPAFTATTGYTYEEAVGRNPRILQSGEHDSAYYETMWDTLNRGDV